MLKGNLSGFSLGEIFQSLAINHHTGTLAITAPDGARKLIYFNKGEIKLFSHGAPVAPRIGEVLVRRGKLTPDQLDLALKTQQKSGKMLGRVLLDEEFLTEEDLTSALTEKIKEEIYDLFLWSEGDFEFDLDSCPEELFDSMQRAAAITVNPNSVIMEGLRRLDEWGVISSWIQTNHEIFVPTGNGEADEGSAEAETLGYLDGCATVENVCSDFSGTRFECCKAIYNLLEEELVRPLTLDELKAKAEEADNEKEFAKATNYWRYAAERCPDEPGLYVKLGESFQKLYRDDEANLAFLSALRLYSDQGEFSRAASIAEVLPASMSLDPKDLRVMLQSFVELKNVKKALWAGNLLAEALQELGETEKAAEVLDSLLKLDPDDLNLRINIATLVQKAGDTERAIRYYEEVEAALEKQKKVKEQIKILRLIAEIAPSRAQVKQKIAMLAILQEKLERRRKRRVTIAGVSVIILVVCTVVPLLYELKAREKFTHAERMEQIALNSGNFEQARAAYEALLTNYGWSTTASDAELAIERIDHVERHHKNDRIAAKERQRLQRLQEQQRNKAEFSGYLTDGEQAEKRGDFKTAHDLFSKALAMGDRFTQGIEIKLPVQLRSAPSGATVTAGETTLGKTPLVFHYDPGTEVSFRLSLRGCEDHLERFKLEKQHQLDFNLARKPSWEYVLRSNFKQSFHSAEGLLIVPSRDGHVYAFDPKQQDTIWQRKVGRFGDRVSDIHVRGRKIYLSTVVGEVASMDATSGTPHWVRSVIRGPVLASPVTSPDGRFVAVASLLGEVAILAERSGEVVGSFKTDNEIVAAPTFVGDLLIVGSTDSHLYGFSTKTKKLDFVREVSAEIVVDPVVVENNLVVPTKDGKVHIVSVASGEIVWSQQATKGEIHSLVAVGKTVLVAASNGQVVPVETAERALGQPFTLDDRPLGGIVVKAGTLYATHSDGLLSVWDLESRTRRWTWQANSPVSVPPVVTKETIVVACHSGAVEVLEILE